MIEKMFLFIVRLLLKIRYKIDVQGLDQIENKKRILFLPNHPALLDPVIVMSLIYNKFQPRPLADQYQVEKPFIRSLMKRVNPVIIPDLTKSGRSAHQATIDAMNNIITGLKDGDNILFYPAGRLYRSNKESIRGNSGVYQIVSEVDDINIVLVRISGMWGSSFGWANEDNPALFRLIGKYLISILCGFLFFVPKRRLTVEFVIPDDFPVDGDKNTINRYLEAFYNREETKNIYVPYNLLKFEKEQILSERESEKIVADTTHIPEETKKQVIEHLREMTGVSNIKMNSNLSRDLGLDSLSMVDLASWLENEFGIAQDNIDSIQTVAHCVLAACGQVVGQSSITLKDVPEKWFADESETPLKVGVSENVAHQFLEKAKKTPNKILLADQLAGVKSYRDILLGVFILKKEIEKIDSQYIGIMLPASVSATIIYLATLFAGKIPVMMNWTVGKLNMEHSINTVGVTHILTATTLMSKIKDQGFDYSSLNVNWIMLDELAKKFTLKDKLLAVFKSRFAINSLYKTQISDTAVVLFTSGSESKPKAVPLSHKNFIANMNDYSKIFTFRENDRMMGILPPFHSFGLASGVILPLCMGMKVTYHANPTEGALISKVIALYKPSLLLGTPTFLNGILNGSASDSLKSLRIAITGAEKCPDYVFNQFQSKCPDAVMCEGYGITECSPVVSANLPGSPQKGTIGKVMPSIDYVIVDSDSGEKVSIGGRGKLLLRGGSIFSGYLNHSGKSPFVSFDGKEWYDTGDLVIEDENGVLSFAGRLKRFIKVGGEMISLPAIESVLIKKFPSEEDEVVLAVDSTPDEDHPEVVLFTTNMISREQANQAIRDEGLSALHNVRKVIQIDEIPLLGTGKTDYQTLKRYLSST